MSFHWYLIIQLVATALIAHNIYDVTYLDMFLTRPAKYGNRDSRFSLMVAKSNRLFNR